MFKLHSNYKPTGDQPKAIEKLTNNLINGDKFQTLLGATGTGKTYTIANVIQNWGRNTLILAHNRSIVFGVKIILSRKQCGIFYFIL